MSNNNKWEGMHETPPHKAPAHDLPVPVPEPVEIIELRAQIAHMREVMRSPGQDPAYRAAVARLRMLRSVELAKPIPRIDWDAEPRETVIVAMESRDRRIAALTLERDDLADMAGKTVKEITTLTAQKDAAVAACQHAKRFLTNNDSLEDGDLHPFRAASTLRHLNEAIALCSPAPAEPEQGGE